VPTAVVPAATSAAAQAWTRRRDMAVLKRDLVLRRLPFDGTGQRPSRRMGVTGGRITTVGQVGGTGDRRD
jgi:hypothetical protein